MSPFPKETGTFLQAASFLPFFGVWGCAQQIIRGHIVKPAKGDKVAKGKFVGTPFIAGVHGLGSTQYGSDLRLGQVIILPQSP